MNLGAARPGNPASGSRQPGGGRFFVVLSKTSRVRDCTRFGQKGIGEGGAIGPPAAIANAINDALAPLGVEVDPTPITPRKVLAKIMAACEGARSCFGATEGSLAPSSKATEGLWRS